MKINKNYITVGLLICLFGFLAIMYFSKIYQIGDLPVQFAGALLGSVATAVITYFLLVGQTISEERKERNVKVYETKSTLYQPIIESLWDIYEDRKINTDEVKNLFNSLCKNVVLYINAEKSDEIFNIVKKLTDIATNTSINQNDLKDEIQEHIFRIINILAEDIDLGGSLSITTRTNIKAIQDKLAK